MGTPQFPPSQALNTQALARLFQDTSTSYKFLFFLGLLEVLKEQQFSAERPIALKAIAVRMLALAWYPATHFRLSFGWQDRISTRLAELNLSPTDDTFSFDANGRTRLIAAIAEKFTPGDLIRFVPFRLIRVFFGQEHFSKDDQVNRRIAELASERFESDRPLYCFDDSVQSLILHPEWASYLRDNYSIVHAWAAWEWLDYMQRRNPNTPAIGNKLFPPQSRESLSQQTRLWSKATAALGLQCVYSGASLADTQISLDHFVPWSFVSHDRMWNLLPTLPSVNSSKGNRLPSPKYLKEFVDIQFESLWFWSESLPKPEWEKLAATYVEDLRIANAGELLKPAVLRDSLRKTLEPVLELAAIQGFEKGWAFRASGR